MRESVKRFASATADGSNAARTSNPPPNFRPTRKVREGECCGVNDGGLS